jgi:transposase
MLCTYFTEKLLGLKLSPSDNVSARTVLSHWIMAAQNSGLSRFVACANTMIRWSKGILNSFDCSYTNGFTEGANNKIKVLKRNAYGYRNFTRFRNHILHMFHVSTKNGAA